MDTIITKLIEQSPYFGTLAVCVWQLWKDRQQQQVVMQGLVREMVAATKDTGAAVKEMSTTVAELTSVVRNLQTEVAHVAAHSETQRMEALSITEGCHK